jgi:hypothetical protein
MESGRHSTPWIPFNQNIGLRRRWQSRFMSTIARRQLSCLPSFVDLVGFLNVEGRLEGAGTYQR